MRHLYFLFFLISCLFSEEIEINLQTTKPLHPVYISKIFTHNSEFSQKYLKDAKSILEFDMNYNAFTEVVLPEEKKDNKISHPDNAATFDQKFWKSQKIAYVIKNQIINKSLITSVFNVENNFLKTFSSIELSGCINKDRTTFHKLSDNIQEMLFGQRGIASLKILYTVRSLNEKKNPPWKSEIWISDYDGENAKQLTYDNSYFVHPIFVPQSSNKEYIFVSYINEQPKLFKGSLLNNQKTPLIKLRGNQLLPSISLNANKIAFISDAAGRPDVFLQNIDTNSNAQGKPIQLFSCPKATNASPNFSPDGEKLAFVSDKDGTPRIYVIKIPNSNIKILPIPHLITKKNRQNVTPSWSKDGKKLAYSAKTDAIRQIWVYDFENNEEKQLTYGPKNKENPFWANDNLHIIYNTEDNTESELYLINIKQKKPIKITKGDGRKRFPSFEP